MVSYETARAHGELTLGEHEAWHFAHVMVQIARHESNPRQRDWCVKEALAARSRAKLIRSWRRMVGV